MTPEQVADQLKMTPRRVMEIEADNVAVVQSKAVFRGFVRAYAKVLRMDPEPLVAMLSDEATPAVSLQPMRNRTLETFSETHIPFIAKYNMQTKRMTVAVIVVVLLIGILLAQRVGWMPSLKKDANVTASASASAPSSAQVAIVPAVQTKQASASAGKPEKIKQIPLPAVDVSDQVAGAPAKKVNEVKKTGDAPKPGVENKTTTKKSVVASPPLNAAKSNEKAAQPAQAANGKNALVLKCREESWVELKRANGQLLASRYIAAGTTARFTVNEPLLLTIGNAPAVEATLRGRRLNVHTDGDSKTVRLNIK
jgi:cytoskeleton protein RodZ